MNTNPPELPPPSLPPATDQLRVPTELSPNIALAIGAGAAAALISAGVWAAVTVAAKVQIGWMAVGVGFLVGYAVGHINRGRSSALGYAGAILALFGCLLGNALSILGFISIQENVSFFRVLAGVDYSRMPRIMAEVFEPMDLLFYGIAVYEGFKFSTKVSAKP